MPGIRSIRFFLSATLAIPLAAAGYQAGVAKIDITPDAPIWMSGYGARTKPSTGVLHPIWAKALAIRDSKNHTIVIISTDLIGLPRTMTDRVAIEIRQKHGIDRAGLIFNSSHTHTGPMVRANLMTMFDLNSGDMARIESYANELTGSLVGVIGAALAKLEPVDLSYGSGEAPFAMNRREPTPTGIKNGVNRAGPVDRAVPVIRVATRNGKNIAIVNGYACHNTTLTGEFYEISGDYAGFSQVEIEKANPGATSLFLMLCGADSNPYPRSKLELAQQHGASLAAGTQKVLNGEMEPIKGDLRTAFEETRLRFAPHTRETFETELQSKLPAAVRRAKLMLKKYDEGLPVRDTPFPVQAVSFGKSLTLLAFGGETVLDYAIRARREYPKTKLVVLGYSNDVMCYIPSQRVLHEGGYEAVDSMIYYGQPGPFADDVEESVFASVERVMKRAGAGKRRGDPVPAPGR